MRLHITRYILLIACFLIANTGLQAQVKLSFEGGAAYFSNNAGDTTNHLTDFIALTLNSRMVLHHSENSAFAIEVPVSFRSKINGDITSRVGIHLPLLITYSIGSGSGGHLETTREKKIGATAGFGWGYFFQRSRSGRTALTSYNEVLETSGPEIQLGVRVPLKKQLILFDKNNPANMVLAFKSNYLFNIPHRDRDIASLAVLLGFHF